MPQARGSLSTIGLYEETVFGADPSTPAGKKLYFTSESISAKQNLLDPSTITGSRTRIKPVLGNFDVSGTLNVELGAENHGTLLKHALGAVSTTGANPYTHVITLADLPVGMVLEKDFGSAISGSGRFEKLNGCRVGGVTFSFPTEGFVTGAFDIVGAASALASATIDAGAGLDDSGNTPFSSFSAAILEGGSAIATVTAVEIRLDNGLDTGVYAIGGAGARRALPEGFAAVSGSVTTLFESAALLTKARASTDTQLKITLSRGTGDGSAGNESIEFLVKEMVYEVNSPVIEGPAGLSVQLGFRGFKASGGTDYGLKITVKNAIATI